MQGLVYSAIDEGLTGYIFMYVCDYEVVSTSFCNLKPSRSHMLNE